MNHSLLLYAPRILPPSQTFVAAQARAMTRWRPTLVGRQYEEDGLDVSDLVYRGDRPSRAPLQRLTRRVPGLDVAAENLDPDIIHAHFLTGGIEVLTTLRQPTCPVVVTAHGFDATTHGSLLRTRHPGRLLFGWQRRRLLEHPSVSFLAVSRFVRERLVALGAAPSAVRVHYIGIDTTTFTPSPEPRPRARVLFVGRLVEQKGVADLVRALTILEAEGMRVQARIVGDGPDRRRLERLARRERLCVEFLGRKRPDEVLAEMSRASLLCGPSRTATTGDREGLGHVFAEAQAAGLPVVATRSGGIPEIVVDGRTGMLVDESSPADLAAALRTCLSDDGLRARYAAEARDWVLRNFDLATQTRKLERLYDELAEHARTG